ncbi:hypothetical protein [Amycolatopsis sp. lyj-109]|uniref:hypothetical protein n=1 Tax=Amycolatopsis sp. lyj-109 TaxID=2789287 RepID=UPI00397AA415
MARKPRSTGEEKDRVRWGLAFTGGLLGLAFALSLVNVLPSSLAGGWQRSQRDLYTTFWPQGWAFFAERPRNGVVVAYALNSRGGLGDELTGALTVPGNLAGLSRRGYTRIVEAQALAARVPAGGWHECQDSDLDACLRSSPARRTVIANEFVSSSLCGTAVLAVVRAGAAAEKRAAVRLVRVELACH